MDERRTSHILLASAAFLWCVLIVVPPIAALLGRSADHLSEISSLFFSRVCHQDTARSLFLFGAPLAVCARCTLIYLGFFVGVLLYPLVDSRMSKSFRLWFIPALLPMLIDVGLEVTGLHPSTLLTRAATGGFFGVGAALLITPLAVEGTGLVLRRLWKSSPHPNLIESSEVPHDGKTG